MKAPKTMTKLLCQEVVVTQLVDTVWARMHFTNQPVTPYRFNAETRV